MSENEIKGNRENVARLANAMLAGLEHEYNSIDERPTVADLMLAAHNAHRMVIEDVLDHTTPTKHQRYALIAGARETWVRSMDQLIHKRADGGKDVRPTSSADQGQAAGSHYPRSPAE